jgi:MFS family permease
MSITAAKAPASALSFVMPLALAQFICSFAGSNMNVAITDIAKTLGTTVHGVQTTITLFTLTMAALMIPGSKLTDILGRKVCFMIGLVTYGIGGLIAALAPSLGVMVVGYSILEGVGSSLLIPPVYILVTVAFSDLTERAKWFGVITMAAGIGAAAGPLIGGVVTSAISWRASFILQVLVVASIVVLSRNIDDPELEGARPRFDVTGAILSAAGLFCVVLGLLLSGTYGWFTATQDFSIGGVVIIPKGGISPVWLAEAIGAVILVLFFWHIRSWERKGKEPLLPSRLFRNITSNRGLVTQNIQWLILQGSFFVVSVFLQEVRGYNAIQTGLILTPATCGILLAGGLAQRMAQRRSQRRLIQAGFVVTLVGMLLLLWLVSPTSNIISFVPGLLLMGLGVGVMLTASVNVVQSSWPEKDQGEISGLSRSISNLGSSFGTALVGSVLVSSVVAETKTYGLAFIVLAVFAGLGLVTALLLPKASAQAGAAAVTPG